MQNKLKYIYSLIGQKITFKRIVGNSIILYFNGRPGDSNIQTIWIEPLWRYEKNGKYILGSSDFPQNRKRSQTEIEYNKEFSKICNYTKQLYDAKVLDIKFNDVTNDIYIELEGQQSLQTFVASNKHEIWFYKNNLNKIRITAYIDRVELDKVIDKFRFNNKASR